MATGRLPVPAIVAALHAGRDARQEWLEAVKRLGREPRDALRGLGWALELADGRNASVEHVRCAVEGDSFCEWDLRWSEEGADRTEA